MKKIVAGAAIAALSAGLVFADGPTVNINFAEFNGNSAVEWGVDLDSGRTGFNNTEQMKITINLFDAGTKATASKGNDIWGEIQMKAGNTGWWAHRLYDYNYGTNDGDAINQGPATGGTLSFNIEGAKIHFGEKVYVGIEKGDTQTGALKLTSAIRSADNDNATRLTDVGPAGYIYGITAGYTDNNIGAAVDFRSKPTSNTKYTSDYAMAAEASLKDSNEWVKGLNVTVGGSYSLSLNHYDKGTDNAVKTYTYGNAPYEGHTAGYSASVGYKYDIDDKYYVKPMAGMTGTFNHGSYENKDAKTTSKATENSMNAVAGVHFGWGATADANAGVYFLDNDNAKKVTPGIAVTAEIPLATVAQSETTVDGKTTKAKGTTYVREIVKIRPSFYMGTLVENLKAAGYGEIIAMNAESKTETSGSADDSTTVTYTGAADKDATTAIAFTAALAYDVKSDDITITPQVGVRYANAAYADNGYAAAGVFSGMGIQKKKTEAGKTNLYDGDFFNLKAGVNVAGLIDNTDVYATYTSANLLNGTEYKVPVYDVKLGTLVVGAKIHF